MLNIFFLLFEPGWINDKSVYEFMMKFRCKMGDWGEKGQNLITEKI